MDYEEYNEPIKENIVVDYEGNEILVGDKVRFIAEAPDGEEEYWVGTVNRITEFSADADDDGVWYGVEPQVVIDYVYMGNPTTETFLTTQQLKKSWVFACEELEIIEKERDNNE